MMHSTPARGTRVLVTGANGFVGQAVSRHLAARGVTVRAALRSASSGPDSSAWRERSIVGDLTPDTEWTAAVDSVDAVLHLAARVHVMDDRDADPLAAFRRTNVDATLQLARAAAAAGVRRFVFVSSIKVNGEETTGRPFSELDPPAPLDPYGKSKLEAECALRELSRGTGLEVVVVRPPLVYGPNVKGNFLRMIQWIDRKIPLPLGSAHNLRSLVGVENLSSALAACLLRAEAAGQTFLVSDTQDLSTVQLLRRTASALGRPAYLLPFPIHLLRLTARIAGQAAAVQRLSGSLVVDPRHIQECLGWKPPCSIDNGLAATAAWYLELRQGRSL